MQCLRWQYDMKFIEVHKTYRKDGKEYNRAIYQCGEDDIWVTVEVPSGKILDIP